MIALMFGELNNRPAANSTYPQWLDFLGFTLVFHEQNFILAERTLLAFSPLRVAAKRWWQAHFLGAKEQLPEIANLKFLNRAVEICSTLS